MLWPISLRLVRPVTRVPFAVSRSARVDLGLFSVFLGSLAINVSLAWALGVPQILSGEEMSVSIRDPFYLELRRQYAPICTNIAGHIFYWVGQRLTPVPSLFFGRYEKAIAMSLVPVLVAVYLERRRVAASTARWTGALLAVMPGLFLFAPLATENGLECVTGMAALCLACSDRAAVRWMSAPLASWTALTYGAGIAFVPAIVWQVVESERARGRWPNLAFCSTWLVGFGLPWIVPFVIWKNHPHLLTGGGTLSDLATLMHHLGQLARETSVRGGSYYYFATYPALSQPGIAVAVVAAIACLCVRREHAAVAIGWLAAVGLFSMSGREIGMRRGVPIVVLGIAAIGLAWPWLRQAASKLPQQAAIVAVAVSLSLALGAFEYAGSVARFVSGEWRVPLDFDFRLLPGMTMPETFRTLLAHPDAVTDAYEPERTWTALRFLAERSPEGAAGTRVFSHEAIADRLSR